MIQKNSLISVIIPVYNTETFIGEAIESVLHQDYAPLEIIVVDDGSTDATVDVVKKFKKIRYVFQENSGAPTARNHGLELAQGEIVCFLDADDLWPENKIDLQLLRFKQDPTLEIVIGRQRQYRLFGRDAQGLVFKLGDEPEMVLSLGASLFRRSVFEKVGLFDAELLHTDDWDWIIRAKDLGVSIGIFPEVTLINRLHENNITRDQEGGKRYLLKMLKKNIDRRHQRRQSVIETFRMSVPSEQNKRED